MTVGHFVSQVSAFQFLDVSNAIYQVLICLTITNKTCVGGQALYKAFLSHEEEEEEEKGTLKKKKKKIEIGFFDS